MPYQCSGTDYWCGNETGTLPHICSRISSLYLYLNDDETNSGTVEIGIVPESGGIFGFYIWKNYVPVATCTPFDGSTTNIYRVNTTDVIGNITLSGGLSPGTQTYGYITLNYVPNSSSSSQSFSESSSSESNIVKEGVTYYNEFIDLNSVNNPLIDNETHMQFNGFFDKDWDEDDFEFLNFGYGLQKKNNNKGSIYCQDASKLFEIDIGYVGMLLYLPYDIENGVYAPLKGSADELSDNILFGVNVGERDISQPGLYAALTKNGIQFVLWSSSGYHSILDNISNVNKNTNVWFEFFWNRNSVSLSDSNVKMAIKVNNTLRAIGNPPIAQDSIQDLNFYALNTPFEASNLECTIRKLLIKNDEEYV